VLVCGGAETLEARHTARLRQLLGRGVARAAAQMTAVIVDGGTRAGVMEVMGLAVADGGHKTPLIGVAPQGQVDPTGTDALRAALDPNHSHIVLAPERDWGGERELLFSLVTAVAGNKPVVVVAAGGGELTLAEVLQAVRHRWPVILIEGVGGVTDELAALARQRPATIDEPARAEIADEGELSIFPLGGAPDALARRVERAVDDDRPLRTAWERFAVLDLNATLQQGWFRAIQAWILVAGVAAAVLGVSKIQFAPWLSRSFAAERALHWTIVVLPIGVSIAIAAANRFKPGNKWLLLRAAAETVKREIFQYRARAGVYRAATRQETLAQRVEDITRRLSRTEANASALVRYSGPIPPKMFAASEGDDGMNVLLPDRYVAVRVEDQLRYYRRRAEQLNRALVIVQTTVLILGGVGTLVAALEYSAWVAITTTVVTALTTYLGYRQIENTLATYNSTATDLENLRGWWLALAPEAQADAANVDKLVEHAENVLDSEMDGWVQKMQDALAELRKEQEDAAKGGDKDKPPSS
jgi:TRPM family ion channel/conflict system pore-forming effector with SLATT domain/uncharacterized protein DUF4231